MDLKEEDETDKQWPKENQENWRMWDSGKEQKKMYQDRKNDQLSQKWWENKVKTKRWSHGDED